MPVEGVPSVFQQDKTLAQPSAQCVLPPGLDSGDVVLFNRRCRSMPPAGAALCVVAKLFSNSQWDHVGIIIRHPATGELLFLEADFGGVKLRSLEQRVLRSKSNEIAVRRLSALRTNSMREKFYAFAQEMVGRPYDIGTGSVLARVADPLAKQEKERLTALLVDKKAQVDEITHELETAALTTFQRRLLQSECDRVSESCNQIQQRLTKEMDVSSPFDKYNADAHNSKNGESEDKPENTELTEEADLTDKSDLSHVFCSELVAAAYQRVGLLGIYPPAFHYNPKDFSSQQTHPPGVHLLKAARLGNEEFIRRLARVNREQQQIQSENKRSLEGVVEGAEPSRDARQSIREVLKRTPIYNQVPDEYKRNHLLKSFRARIVEPGDVVFEQGQYGDKLFIVESGAVERFIQKGESDPTLINTMGPRCSFGLSAFSYNSPRMSTVRAKERSLLWVLDRPTFELFRDASSDIKSILSTVDNRQLRQYMQQHFLFQRLDKIGYEQVNAFFAVKFRAGETVFKQGDPADNLYIIKGGELERHIRRPKPTRSRDGTSSFDKRNDNEEETLIKTLKSGQSFGELSLMYNAPRSATIRARTDVECWALSLESFNKLNLSGGTQHLRAVFNKNASVFRDGTVYMTRKDLMRFAGVDAFPEAERERLTALLVSLVASNRQGAPDSNQMNNDRNNPLARSPAVDAQDDDDVLMDFWEFVRFDIVLNQPSAELAFAFRLADLNNSGFISLDEMENLLQSYAPIDETAGEMLSGRNASLRKVFGRDGTRTLTAREFYELSEDILPPKFVSDVKELTDHMLNMDFLPHDLTDEYEELAFIEPEGGLSIIGSNFMNSSVTRAYSGLSRSRSRESLMPKWITNLDWGHLISVGMAGAASRTAVAPFERLKILMQTKGTKYYPSSWVKSFRTMIHRDTSLFRALFRGNGANVIRIVPSAAIQLMVVDRLREMKIIRKLMDRDLNRTSPSEPTPISGGVRTRAVEAVLVGGIAGMVAATATYPFDFIRGRLSIQHRKFEPYRGTIHGIRQTIKNEGFFSLYRGLGPTLAGVFPYVGLSFGIYETLRPILPKKNDRSGIPTTGSSIVCGMVATATGQVASFPLDTCRRRMQVAGFSPSTNTLHSPPAMGFVQIWREIQTQLGWRGFFRGLMPNLLKIAPASAVSFVAYEQVRGGMQTAEQAANIYKAQTNRLPQ